jgi:hypothetical protein
MRDAAHACCESRRFRPASPHDFVTVDARATMNIQLPWFPGPRCLSATCRLSCTSVIRARASETTNEARAHRGDEAQPLSGSPTGERARSLCCN